MKKTITILETGYADVAALKPWEDNPRIINQNEVRATANQIKELGQYKPILVDEEGVVIGGNARLQAMNLLGETRVWVSIVRARTHAEKLFVAMADNDMVGTNDEGKLMDLIRDHLPESFADYTVDFGGQKSVADILAESGIGNIAPSDAVPTIEKIILPFSNEDYERVLDALDKVMEENGLEDHTEAVIHLLENYA